MHTTDLGMVSALYIYPVKSLGGFAVSQAEVQERGFRYDRRWMLVDDQGQFLTQRSHPKMALVKTILYDNHIGLGAGEAMPETMELPVQTGSGVSVQVRVWNDRVEALWPQLEADAWISDFLGVHCRFVYMTDAAERTADVRYYPSKSGVSFADSFPYLLTSEGSLDELKRRSGVDLDMRRFRPNIVVSGSNAYEEDRWKTIRLRRTVFKLVKPCARCVVTTIDPDTGRRGKEPLRTLAAYRNQDGKTLFGQNMVAEGRGRVAVGDPVEVLEWRNDG